MKFTQRLSLRVRLTLIFLILASVTWLLSSFVAWKQTTDNVDELFDTQLMLFAKRLSTLDLNEINAADRMAQTPNRLKHGHVDDDALTFAIFTHDGRMVLNDGDNGEDIPYSYQREGFADGQLVGEDDPWRFVWMTSPDGKYRIVVGQEWEYREDMALAIVAGKLIPWLVALPIMLIIMMVLLGRELAPLNKLALALRMRDPDSEKPLNATGVPSEVRPLVESLNQLFARTHAMMVRERRFTSDAAHELRSPLTALKVQTEVAQLSDDDPQARKKALLQFPTAQNEEVLVKVGISAVDIKGAQRNVETEIPSWDFDSIMTATQNKWNDYLETIQVEGNNETQKQIFYTALYHTAIHPSLFSDADGRYRGLDQMIHQTKPGKEIYTVYSLWDTFRALHPLLTIIKPDLNEKLVMSLMQKYHEGGILPMWELAGNYTATMIGYHAIPVIVDAYMKGFDKIDGKELLEACIRSSVYDTTGIIASSRMVNGLVPISKYYKNKIGYVPYEKENESVAKGLEYAYNDWCIARLAEEIGDTATYEKYKALSKSYINYYDPQTGFMRGKDLKGNWHVPFNPRYSDHRNDDYCEGTAWQWAWFVPHDIEGLIALMGGQEKFIGRLDSLFVAESKIEGPLVSSDISGLIGQYAHGNEPSHHIVHLYNYVNQSWKAQQLIDTILHTQYFNNPNGLSGNEDCGQMSAWYVLNAMGFYQVCPGSPIYSVGRPIFDKVTINLPNGKVFEIIANNNSRTNKYIQRIRLDNILLESPFFMHSDIMKGGKIVMEMGNTPVKQ